MVIKKLSQCPDPDLPKSVDPDTDSTNYGYKTMLEREEKLPRARLRPALLKGGCSPP
jgi:hypothetical protein